MRPANCECGGSFVMTNIRGRTFEWKSHRVELLYDLEAQACDQCSEVIFRVSQLPAFNHLLERSFTFFSKPLGVRSVSD